MDEINSQTYIIKTNENTHEELEAVAKKLYGEKKYDQALKIYSDMLLYTTDALNKWIKVQPQLNIGKKLLNLIQ